MLVDVLDWRRIGPDKRQKECLVLNNRTADCRSELIARIAGFGLIVFIEKVACRESRHPVELPKTSMESVGSTARDNVYNAPPTRPNSAL